MFKKPFSFEGRIGRFEFAISWLILLIGILLYVLIGFWFRELVQTIIFEAFTFVVCIILTWFSWAQGAKRSHDINMSMLLYIFFRFLELYCFLKKGRLAQTPMVKIR